jgi:hypothetical protein
MSVLSGMSGMSVSGQNASGLAVIAAVPTALRFRPRSAVVEILRTGGMRSVASAPVCSISACQDS